MTSRRARGFKYMQSTQIWLQELNPNVAFSLMMLGLVYGLFGWRLVRYLAVLDAGLLGLLLVLTLRGSGSGGETPSTYWPALALLLLGLPWVAWRFPRWSVVAMGGLVGFLLTQFLLQDETVPMIARLGLGAIGSGLVMAFHVTLFRETSIFVTGLHGGVFFVAALAASANVMGSSASRFLYGFNGGQIIIPLLALVFSAMLILFQWADSEQHA